MSEKKINVEFAGAATIEGLLARHFREVLRTLRINEEKWNERMTAYLEAEGIEAHLVEGVRTNLTKQLSEPEMSWNTYRKGMKMLQQDSISIAITGYGDGRVSQDEMFFFHD